MARSEIIGMKELERSIKQLGQVPQRSVTKAARRGATIALKAARANAPIDTGQLRQGIILKGERRVKIGKKVYDVMMDPAMNDVFVKHHTAGWNNRRAEAGDEARSYYPASMEYGFFTADGRYIPGDHFLRQSITGNARAIEQTMVDVLSKDIDQALGKG